MPRQANRLRAVHHEAPRINFQRALQQKVQRKGGPCDDLENDSKNLRSLFGRKHIGGGSGRARPGCESRNLERPAPPAAPQLPATSANMQGKTASQFYKNIKVLKDIPAADIHPAMEYITVALGVGCAYCHDPRKFDDDGKQTKRSARNMMQMMFALDSTVFADKREITCYTCHRGAPIGAAEQLLPSEKAPTKAPSPDSFANIVVPNLTLNVTMAPVRPGPGDAPAAAPPANAPKPAPVVLPSLDDVFAKYQQAIGGMASVQKVSTLVQTGTVEMLVPNPPGVQGPPGSATRLWRSIARRPARPCRRFSCPMDEAFKDTMVLWAGWRAGES